tara:strand:+ start:278 stop:547 length:270 start_codon:yes stop_codon:yes gene_type:complete
MIARTIAAIAFFSVLLACEPLAETEIHVESIEVVTSPDSCDLVRDLLSDISTGPCWYDSDCDGDFCVCESCVSAEELLKWGLAIQQGSD